MKIKVLGTCSPHGTCEHNCPGYLITSNEAKILLDVGSGTHKLLKFPDDLEDLHVIITHLHRDHYNDIYNLQYSSFVYHNQKRLENLLYIHLPSTPVTRYDDVINEKYSYAIYYAIAPEKKLEVGDIEVSFLRTDHSVETYAVKLKSGNETIVYTSDTSFSAKDRIIEFAKEADVLISESSLLTSYGFPEINSHLTAGQAGIIAKEANVKMLVLTHFWPEESPENFVKEAKKVFTNVVAASEGQVIELS